MRRNQTQWSLRTRGNGAITPGELTMVHAQFLYQQWHSNGTGYRHTLLRTHLDHHSVSHRASAL